MADEISEVTQYYFNTEELTVIPKHVKLLRNKEDLTGISGLEKISNHFKTVNIYAHINIREIGLVSSKQAKKKKEV